MRTSSIVSSAVIALTVVGAPAATVPGSNGKLAYFYGAEIFTVQSNGKELRSLGAGLSLPGRRTGDGWPSTPPGTGTTTC